MNNVKWQDPAEIVKGPNKYVAVREAMRANPGKWAVIREGAAHANGVVTMRASKSWAGFELAVRRGPSGYTYYARYVGEQS